MGSLRTQVGWMARGGERVEAALDEHAEAIRELQQQVAALAAAVSRVERQLPDELRSSVDDLSDRIGALAARLDEDDQ